MKKIFLLSILLFQLTFVFGQNIGQEYSLPSNGDWGLWQTDKGYKGISYRLKIDDEYMYTGRTPETRLNFEIKNSYKKDFNILFMTRKSAADLKNDLIANTTYNMPTTLKDIDNVTDLSRMTNFEVFIKAGEYVKYCEGCGTSVYGKNLTKIYVLIEYLHNYLINNTNTGNIMRERHDDGSLCYYCQYWKNPSQTPEIYNEWCGGKPNNQTSGLNEQIDGNNLSKNDAINQLTTTIISGIQEQKEWSAEQKRLKAERLQRAEEYMKNLEQKFINEINLADSGDIDKQNWVAYQFYDKQKYELAEEYYKMVMSNKDDSKIIQRESSSNNLASCYAINGKFLEQWNELNKKITSNTLLSRNTFQRTMLVLFSEKYEINTIVSDEMIKSAIQDLKNEKLLKSDAEVVLAYFQITGEYKLLGIPKNETEGLEILAKNTYSELASYFIGVLHLKGIGLKQDEKKAFDNFLNVIKLNKNQKNYKKFNVNSKSDLDFYKPIQTRHDIYQLTPLIMAYSEIAILLEKSSKDSDRNLLKYKNEFFEWFGNLLTLDDRTFWKINIVENPFLQTEKK